WYESLCRKQIVVTLDLKDEAGRRRLEELLAGADVLLASFRPSALRRLQLDWESLRARHPRLCLAGIIGYPPPLEERSGHDLTYLASAGLLAPPQLPLSLFVDLAGAERCVSMVLALLLRFSRTNQAGCEFVSLYECASDLAAPWKAGLTRPDALLGAASALYSISRTSGGWIAVAALEPHFAHRLLSKLGPPAADRARLEETFRNRSAAAWEEWAIERGLPLAALLEKQGT